MRRWRAFRVLRFSLAASQRQRATYYLSLSQWDCYIWSSSQRRWKSLPFLCRVSILPGASFKDAPTFSRISATTGTTRRLLLPAPEENYSRPNSSWPGFVLISVFQNKARPLSTTLLALLEDVPRRLRCVRDHAVCGVAKAHDASVHEMCLIFVIVPLVVEMSPEQHGKFLHYGFECCGLQAAPISATCRSIRRHNAVLMCVRYPLACS